MHAENLGDTHDATLSVRKIFSQNVVRGSAPRATDALCAESLGGTNGSNRSGAWSFFGGVIRGFGLRRIVASTALGLMVSVLSVAAVFADATPVQLVLLYMPNVSNDGATAASGIAELLLPEGEVRINAAGMPHLEGEQRYVAWVLNSSNSEFLRLGSFNSAEPSGTVHFETVLPDAIPDRKWNMLLLTVEASDHPAHPSGSHNIAGIFPRREGEPLPSLLPNTGGAPDEMPILQSGSYWPAGSGLAALTLVAGFGAGYVARSRAGASSHSTFRGTRDTRR